jgi:hypothetical protein
MPVARDTRKLVGGYVPENAISTRQGPKLRRENGQFAPMKFEEVKLAVLPEKEVQWLFERLSVVVEGILMLDNRLNELRGAVGKLQDSVDQIILRLDRDLMVELEHVRKLLKRADGKGDRVREFLSENEKDIVSPLRKVEMGIEGSLADTGLPPEVRVCLLRRFVMLRHIQAKVSLACGEESEARDLLQKTRGYILELASALVTELTSGVAILDVPEVDSVENELKFLQLMELIDGKAPDDRRFMLRKSTPVPPDEMSRIPLESKQLDGHVSYGYGTRYPKPGEMVRKGQVVRREQNRDWVAPASGYLLVRGHDLASIASAQGYIHDPMDYFVLEIPTLEVPHPNLADLIADLAFVVDYARRLDAEMDVTSGNGELAKRLFAPDGGEAVNPNG